MSASERMRAVDGMPDRQPVGAEIDQLCGLALKALPAMYRTDSRQFVQTVRKDPSADAGLRQEGSSLRYSAIVALGLAWTAPRTQHSVLSGWTAAELARHTTELSVQSGTDLGAVALAGWARAEVADEISEPVYHRLVTEVRAGTAQPMVDFAWTLTALLAALAVQDRAELRQAAAIAAERLLAAQGGNGIWGHHLPMSALARYRAHVGCFADQVYPIQALARYARATGDGRALAAANRCARRIVELQGPAGQWWWHYDARTGDVVEGYPVYSVHQHAMAPMALFDLLEAGGADHRTAILDGLGWLRRHPEPGGALIDQQTGAIWRKIGRREPRKATRSLRAVSTSISPNWRLRALDTLFKPGELDYECRPYELGWLLYAWLSGGISGARPPGIEPATEAGG
ncbi:MAG TPA: hypothetical protein VJ851_10965 [Jatrophihabitans sp.]|nr:hypothetical protein [Jatrophihabitans sp.]